MAVLRSTTRENGLNCLMKGKTTAAVCFIGILLGTVYILHPSDNLNNNESFTAKDELNQILVDKLTFIQDELQSIKQQESHTAVQVQVDQCRNIFKTQGQGGIGTISPDEIKENCSSPNIHNACKDLQEFTGLSDLEFNTRMQREGRFHFEGEHLFWNPQSRSELAWYYATSVNYLFANTLHASPQVLTEVFNKTSQGPVLDYSGGVGNNIIALAKAGIPCQYFGIGMMEYTFAEYRVQKYQLEHLVTFVRPWNSKTNWSFDPINAALPRNGSLGGIVAFDVLEHIPDYQNVVKAMVESLRVGGIILENSPFGDDNSLKKGEEDLRVHVSNGGITMAKAMGESMKNIGEGQWQKVQ